MEISRARETEYRNGGTCLGIDFGEESDIDVSHNLIINMI